MTCQNKRSQLQNKERDAGFAGSDEIMEEQAEHLNDLKGGKSK